MNLFDFFVGVVAGLLIGVRATLEISRAYNRHLVRRFAAQIAVGCESEQEADRARTRGHE